MSKTAMLPATTRLAAAKRREEQALEAAAKERAERAEKTARLKALRLAKQAEKKRAENASVFEGAPKKAERKSGLPQAHRALF
jgi:hypothetical protein